MFAGTRRCDGIKNWIGECAWLPHGDGPVAILNPRGPCNSLKDEIGGYATSAWLWFAWPRRWEAVRSCVGEQTRRDFGLQGSVEVGIGQPALSLGRKRGDRFGPVFLWGKFDRDESLSGHFRDGAQEKVSVILAGDFDGDLGSGLASLLVARLPWVGPGVQP